MTIRLAVRSFLPLVLFDCGLGGGSLAHAASIRPRIEDSLLWRWKWPNLPLFFPSSSPSSTTSTSQKEAVETTDVIIVGCSLSGMSLALALLSKNPHIHIIMIEKKPNLRQEQGATFGLPPNGQKAMQEICPAVLSRLYRKSIRLRPGMDVSGAAAANAKTWMLPWWLVRDTLLQQLLRRKKQVTIYAGMNIRSITESPEAVTVHFDNSNLTLTAPVLIGADGVHSFVRNHALHLPDALPSGATVWRGHLCVNERCHRQHQALLRPLVGKHAPWFTGIIVGPNMLGIWNFHERIPHTLLWVLSTKALGIVAGKTTPLDVLQQCVQQHPEVEQTLVYQRAEALFQPYSELQNGRELPASWTLSTRLSTIPLHQSWGGRGRITLVGDAAHALHPTFGQGGSMAFEDAVILALCLAPYFPDKQEKRKTNRNPDGEANSSPVTATFASIPEILRAFEAPRFPRVKSLSEDQEEKANRAYRNQVRLDAWSDAYEAWVFEGPDASPVPPKG